MTEENITYDISQQLMVSFPPDSHHLPVNLLHPDILFTIFDVFIHWTAYFIAYASVTISLLICMAIILFSCACLLELVIQCGSELYYYLKGDRQIKIF